MTVAPPVPPPVPENGGFNDHVHVNSMPPLPRFHPIAMTPNPNLHHHHHHQQPQQPMHPDAAIMHSSHFRPFPVQDSSHPPPIHTPGAIDHIESRLRQLECEEAARMAARSHLLAIRKREDEEFRRVTENAEAEEEVRYLPDIPMDRSCRLTD